MQDQLQSLLRTVGQLQREEKINLPRVLEGGEEVQEVQGRNLLGDHQR